MSESKRICKSKEGRSLRQSALRKEHRGHRDGVITSVG
jgi:hypothetical protein